MVQINNFTGFETQGMEESSATTGPPSINTTDQRSGGACLDFDGTDDYAFPWVADGISDAGTDYIFGFGFRFTGGMSTDAAGPVEILDDSGGLICVVSAVSTERLRLLNAEGVQLGDATAVLNADQQYYFEVYVQLNSASGAWEWFQDGVSIDSGTGADFTDGNAFGSSVSLLRLSNSATTMLYDDVYILSGATAATDRLGGGTINEMPEVFMYQNDLASATADLSAISGGDGVLNSGNWDDAAQTPGSDGASADFTGTPLDGVAYTDGFVATQTPVGGPGFGSGNHYFFDASDAGPTDNDSVWTNDANLFDGDFSTFARCSTIGTEITNELRGEGTNAPASGGTISAVRFRISGNADGSSERINVTVFTDGEAEDFGARFHQPSVDVIFHGQWENLGTPSGGWTWAVVQALEISVWQLNSGAIDAYVIELFVEHDEGTEKLFNQNIDGDSNIKAWKGIWRAERSGGGGTTHTIYIGNDADSEGNFDSDTIALLNNAEDNFTFLGETDPPLSTENFAQGFGLVGNQDFKCREMWATLLHVPSAVGGAVDVAVPLGTFTQAGQLPAVGTGVLVVNELGAFTLNKFDPAINIGVNVVNPLKTFTLNGFDPTIETGVTVVTPLGVFNLAEQLPTIETGVNVILPAVGTFTLTGQLPAVGTGVDIDVGLKTFTLTGFDPVINIGVNVINPLGVFTLTGFDPEVFTGVAVLTPLGAFTLTEQLPTIETGVTIITPLGGFTLAGFDPAINIGVNVINPLGSFTLNKFDPTINTGVNIFVPAPTTFTLTGFAPIIETDEDIIIDVPVGTFTLTGFNPAINIGVNIVNPLGAFTLTGFDPAINIGVNVVNPLGTFTLSPLTPTIETGVTIITPFGTFNLTGFDPTVETGVNVLSPLGLFNLNKFAPVVGTGALVTNPLGSFILTGFDPAIDIGVNVVTPLGNFTLTGQIPTIETGVNIITPLGIFTLTGFIPTIETTDGIEIITPLGTFTLTGQVPSINIGVNVINPLGSFTLTGFSPEIFTGVTIVTPLGTFTLTGFDPTIQTGVNILSPLGSFTVNFIIPIVGSGASVETPLGIFTLTGNIPAVGASVLIDVPFGTAFVLTGFAPTVALVHEIKVPLGIFTISGISPDIHAVFRSSKDLLDLDLTPPFEDIAHIRYLYKNFALLREILAGGVTGQFTTTDGKTIHIRDGVVTDIF